MKPRAIAIEAGKLFAIRSMSCGMPMTVAEKRSVLASWASDACAIESNPALRAAATGSVVSYDDIIGALQSLDSERSPQSVTSTFKRRQRRRRWTKWNGRGGRSDNGDVGSSAFG
jgi:hypothetical protein